MSELRYAGKVVAITGAGSGQGTAMADRQVVRDFDEIRAVTQLTSETTARRDRSDLSYALLSSPSTTARHGS